jgi:hypothetical protein
VERELGMIGGYAVIIVNTAAQFGTYITDCQNTGPTKMGRVIQNMVISMQNVVNT